MVISENKQSYKNYCTAIIVIGLILIIPLIGVQIVPGHDYIFHVSRIEDVAEALKYGIFPVRMYVDQVLFWGAPVGIFYPGLFIYIPASLKLAGLSIEICYNVFIALIFYFGLFASWQGFSMLTRSKYIGFLSSALYISSGYYLLDAYIRNALGELSALSFMPLAIACIINIVNKTKITIRVFILTILSISAVIESHVLSSVFLALFGISYAVIEHNKITTTKLRRIALLSIIIVILNAHFIVPFFIFFKNVPLSVPYIDSFAQSGMKPIFLFRFLIFWNFWIFTFLYVFLSNSFHNFKSLTESTKKQYYHYFIYLFIGFVFFLASSSVFPWNNLLPLKAVFKNMQFSWRFLGISTLFLCICSGYGFYFLLRSIKTSFKTSVIFLIMVCVTNMLAFKYLTPTPFYNMAQKCNWERIRFYCDEDYLYKDLDVDTLFQQDNRFITDAKISNWQKKQTTICFTYDAEHDTEIILPLINYPGYIAVTKTGDEVQVKENHNHMLTISLPKGSGYIKVYHKGFLAFKIADYASLCSFFLLINCLIWVYKKQYWKKTL